MPIVYERAFGGIDRRSPKPEDHAAEPRNLVGVGFRGAPSHDPSIETEVPNIEQPRARMESASDKPEPGGFGIVSRGWQPRLRYAGTFDQNWQASQWPLLPRDFDPRFNQAAPADQQTQSLKSGDVIRVLNMTPDGEWQFELPQWRVPVRFLYDQRQFEMVPRVDTVLIEPDWRRLTLTGRVSVQTRRGRGLLREIVIGHASNAWIRARVTGKRYVGHEDGGAVADYCDVQ
jgi:hypothetical protein